MTSSFFFSFFKECIYTFNHAFFSGRPLSHSFPLCFLLMGIGFSFLVCTIWPFLVRNDYLLWDYLCFLFGMHTFWPFLYQHNLTCWDFFYDNYIWLLYEKACLLYLWPKLVYQLTIILGNTIYFTIITQYFFFL